MSDYHILKQARDKKTINAVFHISVPVAGTNLAGISWRDAVVLDQGGAANINSTLSDVVNTQEETDMKAGAIIEVPTTVRFSSINLTIPQRKAEIEAEFNSVVMSLIAEKQLDLEFMGFNADVP